MFKLIVLISLMFTHLSADVFPLVSAVTSKAYAIPPLRVHANRLKEVLRLQEQIRALKQQSRVHNKTYFESTIRMLEQEVLGLQEQIRAHELQNKNYYSRYFDHIVKLYKQDRISDMPKVMHDPFSHSIHQIAWQMEGLGTFIPDSTSEKALIYVAKKRKATLDIFNSHNLLGEQQEDYHTKLLNEAHTERQLIRTLLLGKNTDARGTILIYTQQAPCQGKSYDNGFFSCIEYYNELAKIFPNITFNIYFEIPSFNESIVKEAEETSPEFNNLILSIIDCLRTRDINSESYFCLTASESLQYNSNFKSYSSSLISASPTKGNSPGKLEKWKDISIKSEYNDKIQFIKSVNSWITAQDKRVQIYFFNRVYGNEKLVFNIIQPLEDTIKQNSAFSF